MPACIRVSPKFRPVLDPGFVPASLWNRAYRAAAAESGGQPLEFALERGDGAVSVFRAFVLPHEGANIALNQRYAERLLKFLLWQKRRIPHRHRRRSAHHRPSSRPLLPPGSARLRFPLYG